jgi:hypothetical protein
VEEAIAGAGIRLFRRAPENDGDGCYFVADFPAYQLGDFGDCAFPATDRFRRRDGLPNVWILRSFVRFVDFWSFPAKVTAFLAQPELHDRLHAASLPVVCLASRCEMGRSVDHKSEGAISLSRSRPCFPIYRRPGSVPRSQLIVTPELFGAFERSSRFPYPSVIPFAVRAFLVHP